MMEEKSSEEKINTAETNTEMTGPAQTETSLEPDKGNNFFFILIVALAIVGGGLWYWKTSEVRKASVTQTDQMPPAVVSDMTVQAGDFSVTAEYTGQTKGYKEAEVRAQVGGILKSKEYTEGGPVKAGQVMFRIDPSPYSAALSRSRSDLKQAEVKMSLAKIEFERVSSLYSKNAVSKNEFDNAEASYKASQAAVDSAKAVVSQSRIDLGWTVVKAPISGLSGKENRSVGNLITMDAAGSLLTTIIQADPVYVDFAVPADEHRINEFLRSAGVLRTRPEGLAVKAAFGDGTFYDKTGKIDFQDQFVDPSTAAIRARALFANPGNKLYPGQFVRVYVEGAFLHNVVGIPLRSVIQTSAGPIVYVLDDSNIPTARNIKIVKTIKNTCLIGEGLKNGERIILDGVSKVVPGKAVTIAASQEDHKEGPAVQAEAGGDTSGN